MSQAVQDQLRHTLSQLAEVFAATVAEHERGIQLLEQELARIGWGSSHPPNPASNSPRIDGSLFTIVFGGRCCFLGNTILFRLMELRPNHFVSVAHLEREVWGGGVRTREAVRSAVKILRRRLHAARMHDLADAVVGRVSGHYAIVLDDKCRLAY